MSMFEVHFVTVETRQLRSEQVKELRDFLIVAYPHDARKSDLRFLDWYFLKNPNVDSQNIPLWVAIDDGKIVGQLATILVQLKVGTCYKQAIWILEFILLPEYRGKGLGKKLVLAAQEKYPTMITLGINEASTRVFDSLGWKRMGSIHRYHKLLYAGNSSRILARMGALRGMLNLLSAPFRYSVPEHKTGAAYNLRHATSLDSTLDGLWIEASAQWPCCVRRDGKFASWQFLEQPGKKFDFLFLYREGKPVGFAALFFRKALTENGYPLKAAISDVVYSASNSDEVIDILIRGALDLAVQRRAGSLVTDVLDARTEARLRRFGFWRIKNSPRFMVSAQDEQELLYRQENWFLTRADSDVSIFEEPNVE